MMGMRCGSERPFRNVVIAIVGPFVLHTLVQMKVNNRVISCMRNNNREPDANTN